MTINVIKIGNLTTAEEELFQLVRNTSNVIHYIRDIKQFFERSPPPSFNINCFDKGCCTMLAEIILISLKRVSLSKHVLMEHVLIEVIMILLENGADINMKNYLGLTALEIACISSSFNVVKLLLVHGADSQLCNVYDISPLWYAIRNKQYAIMEALIEYGSDVNIKNNYNETPIYELLTQCYSWDCVPNCFKLLLDYGADVNVVSENGKTPLAMIVKSYRKDNDVVFSVIRLLLNANADVNITTNCCKYYGIITETILHIAVRVGTIQLVKLILEYHPNLFIYNQDHDTVFDIAIYRTKSNEYIELLDKEHRKQIYKYIYCHWLP